MRGANELDCLVKFRSTGQLVPAHATRSGTDFHIVFNEPQKSITPGQSAVLYDGDLVLGGGIICK